MCFKKQKENFTIKNVVSFDENQLARGDAEKGGTKKEDLISFQKLRSS